MSVMLRGWPAVRAELQRARSAVFAEYVARHGRTPSRELVDNLLARCWYRLSDQAAAALYRAIRRRERRDA